MHDHDECEAIMPPTHCPWIDIGGELMCKLLILLHNGLLYQTKAYAPFKHHYFFYTSTLLTVCLICLHVMPL